MLKPRYKYIPTSLTELPRWVTWKGQKIPFDPSLPKSTASVADPATWGTFEQAVTAYEEGDRDGIGLVLNGDGLVGIDLDDCVSGGQPDPNALSLLEAIGARYIELSPSGRGLRSFGFADPPVRCKGLLNGICVELYATGRYLTVTGHILSDGPITQLPGFSVVSAALTPTEEHGRVQRITDDDRGHLQYSSVDIPIHIIPTNEGQRNKCLFELTRYLKGKYPDANPHELREIVREWHRLSIQVIRTKEFAITWVDFTRAWSKVRFPTGTSLAHALEGIEDDHLPEAMKRFGYGEHCLHLAKICRRLALYHHPEPFFISARQAGDLLEIHFTDAAKLLGALVTDGVIEIAKPSTGKRARRYQWTLSPLPNAAQPKG